MFHAHGQLSHAHKTALMQSHRHVKCSGRLSILKGIPRLFCFLSRTLYNLPLLTNIPQHRTHLAYQSWRSGRQNVKGKRCVMVTPFAMQANHDPGLAFPTPSSFPPAKEETPGNSPSLLVSQPDCPSLPRLL
jgi:hypothetical protein